MADPLSIIASTIGIVDVLFRLGKYLREVHQDIAHIGEDIRGLTNEVEALNSVITIVQGAFRGETDTNLSPSIVAEPDAIANLWSSVDRTLQSCLRGVLTLEGVVKEIFGKEGQTVSGKVDDLLKVHRKRSKADHIRQIRDQIATYQRNLQVLLATINWKSGQNSQEASSKSIRQLSEEIHDLTRTVKTQSDHLRKSTTVPGSYEAQLDTATLTAYGDLKLSLDSAANAITAVSSNEYFDIPQQVSSIFTGRRQILDDMRNFLIAPPGISRDSHQRRFVIYGIGGSGKTQLSCKFAEENRDSFWGVFWIDASNTERIKQTLADIARIAKVEPNANAAMYWLSNIKQRWLLLIDNADDRSIHLENYFPKGNRGHILVTTRNPAHKVHGNVGSGFYDFEKLDANDANQLLLRAADKHKTQNLTTASVITKALDFLALAIIQAGASIREGLCTLENYLPWFEDSWKTISQRRRGGGLELDPVRKVYASWDLNYKHLESNPNQSREDAIEILKTFAFLHREDIRFDILRRAVYNEAFEVKQARSRGVSEEPAPRMIFSWSRLLKNIYTFGFSSGTSPPLPRLLRQVQKNTGGIDHETALRYALRELVQSSLISYNEVKDSYSMHPLQHRYARERLSIGEQGVWAEVAASVLSASIVLPPLGDNVESQEFNRHIIPHLDHVVRCRANLQQATAENRSCLWRKWMFPILPLTRNEAIMYGKFSWIYAQSGRWSDAEKLQLAVRDFTYDFLGPENPKSRLVSLALSNTLWNLGRAEEALNMQRSVLEICENAFGHQHLETLKAKHMLGQTLWLQGRYHQARRIQQEVVDGFTEQLGLDNELTLKAKDNLGRTVVRFGERTDLLLAYKLHSEAVKGMEKVYGPNHTEILWAKESLARVIVDLGDQPFDIADALIDEVLEKRKSNLGKEHPYTLLAMANKALIKNTCGRTQEAEDLIRAGLDVANRNLGGDHVGTLLGRTMLASVLIHQQRYVDAEEILRDTTERQKHMKSHRGDYHPDRVMALVELAKCYRLQGKIDLSIQTCDEALDGFESFKLSTEHVLARDLKRGRAKLIGYQQAVERGKTPDENITWPAEGRYRQHRLF